MPANVLLLPAVNVIPDKPNHTTPKTVQPGSSEVLSATTFLSSLGGPKHAHQVCLNYCHAICCSAVPLTYVERL